MPVSKYPQAGGGTDWSKLTTSVIASKTTTNISIGADVTLDLSTLTGEYIITEIKLVPEGVTGAEKLAPVMEIDGVSIPLYANYDATSPKFMANSGRLAFLPSTASSFLTGYQSNAIIGCKTSFKLQIKNENSVAASSQTIYWSIVYHQK